MSVVKVEREIAGRMLTIETGKVAKQAHGSAWVKYGDTVVLVTVLAAPPSRDLDFFPLFVDYRENRYAAGKVPGGFFKREGRPSTKEILTMRMIDRPIRPLFPKDYMYEVQIQCMVLSTDNENDPDLLAMIGASAALSLSPAPFEGPIGTSKVGFSDDEFIINPTYSDLETSEFLLLTAGPKEAVNMLEMEGKEVSEDIIAEAIELGHETDQLVIEMIEELVSKVKPVKQYEPAPVPEKLVKEIQDKYTKQMEQAKQIASKVERNEKISEIRDEALAQYCPEGVDEPEYTPSQVKEAVYKLEGKVQRRLILDGKRPDGRKPDELRSLEAQVDILPRTHGSAIFARGETMSLATVTLGTPRDEQIIDGLREEYKKSFMLHYNFPPFSVGEIRPIRGPGRREIGHGALAEKSLETIMPNRDDFPYTVRVVAD
ncbi:MAG: polyribonucleotide nucleotidyltransferase, partial [Planctomycetota bacterium]